MQKSPRKSQVFIGPKPGFGLKATHHKTIGPTRPSTVPRQLSLVIKKGHWKPLIFYVKPLKLQKKKKMADPQESPAAMKLEVARLTRELDQTQSEKVQAAKYGMGLLEENSKLQDRCAQLEELYEVTKNELDLTKSALSKTTETHKITEISGIQHEESLLSESAALECSLNSQILDLEGELRLGKQELGPYAHDAAQMLKNSNEKNEQLSFFL